MASPNPEEYELPRISTSAHRRQPSGGAGGASTGKKRVTLHTGPSTTALVYARHAAEAGEGPAASHSGDPGPSTMRHRNTLVTLEPITPSAKPQIIRQTDLFLTEDPTTSPFHPGMGGSGSARDEVVDIPDFGGMLGLSSENPEDNYAVAREFRTGWKRRLFLLMEEPGSSKEAFVVHVASTGTIVASALLTMLSTLPSFHTDRAASKILFGLDTSIVVLFTIEYIARLLGHSDSWRMCWNWATSFFAIVDLLAVLPYYIEVALQQDTTILFRFSILRTLRLLRVFRAFKYQNQMLFTIEVMYIAIHRSKDALLALAFFIAMALVVFSTLIYFAERGVWDAVLGTFVDAEGNPSQFESIPSAAWFVLVTITTVGYGELIPRSVLGRLFTVPLLVFGLLLIALPSFVLGRNFAIVFDAMSNQIKQPIDAAAAHSTRDSLDYSNPAVQPSTSRQDSRSTTPLPPGRRSPSPSGNGSIRVPERGNMVGGVQYDSIPTGEPMTASASLTSFNFGQVEAGRTHPMLPPEEGRVPGSRGAVTGGEAGTAGSAAATLGKNDLTNLKLASNQQILLLEIERLRDIMEKQETMLQQMMDMLVKLTPDSRNEVL
ncbi:hypothetical protein NliqN6_0538 [Naganishia liquefaciens]|uniref:Ion transport domain-containing protein n=1 Tax=Naganishia liquefaciens TaxID=104408 RepID=A0A8H3TN12_9TREE|nr:hypothetical protein NliqN6_0538 [Naganishia liquefaciens]